MHYFCVVLVQGEVQKKKIQKRGRKTNTQKYVFYFLTQKSTRKAINKKINGKIHLFLLCGSRGHFSLLKLIFWRRYFLYPAYWRKKQYQVPVLFFIQSNNPWSSNNCIEVSPCFYLYLISWLLVMSKIFNKQDKLTDCVSLLCDWMLKTVLNVIGTHFWRQCKPENSKPGMFCDCPRVQHL